MGISKVLYNYLSLLTCERDKMLLRAILSGGVWNGFLLGRAKKEDVPCRFCGQRDGDGHLLWECTFLPLQQVRDLPEFATLLRRDRSRWPRCYYGMAGCLGLVVRVSGIAGLLLLVSLPRGGWNVPLVLTLLILLVAGYPQIFGIGHCFGDG